MNICDICKSEGRYTEKYYEDCTPENCKYFEREYRKESIKYQQKLAKRKDLYGDDCDE
jgi:hypothetical protein